MLFVIQAGCDRLDFPGFGVQPVAEQDDIRLIPRSGQQRREALSGHGERVLTLRAPHLRAEEPGVVSANGLLATHGKWINKRNAERFEIINVARDDG